MGSTPLQEQAVAAINSLPPLPQVAMKLIQLLNDPQVSATDVAQLINTDISITAKVLRLANSAFYGIPRTITTINNAVVILGMKMVNSLVLGLAVNQSISSSYQGSLNQADFWRHSLATAVLAKKIAPLVVSSPPIDADEAFCAGLLHDLGHLVLDRYFSDQFAPLVLQSQTGKSLHKLETAQLGVHHGEIGGWLTSKWELPPNLRQPIILHHHPQNATQSPQMVYLIALANALAHVYGYHKLPNENFESPPSEWFYRLNIKSEQLTQIQQTLSLHINELQGAFL